MQLRVNNQIRSQTLRVIDEHGQLLGDLSLDQSLYLAYEQGLDLVEVSPNATPPVARIVDYGKFAYQEAKRAKGAKGPKKQELKEVRLSATIDTHDLQTKVARAKKFLAEGDKVMVAVKMRGRQNIFSQQVLEILYQFEQLVGGKFESPPRRLGSMWRGTIGKLDS